MRAVKLNAEVTKDHRLRLELPEEMARLAAGSIVDFLPFSELR